MSIPPRMKPPGLLHLNGKTIALVLGGIACVFFAVVYYSMTRLQQIGEERKKPEVEVIAEDTYTRIPASMSRLPNSYADLVFATQAPPPQPEPIQGVPLEDAVEPAPEPTPQSAKREPSEAEKEHRAAMDSGIGMSGAGAADNSGQDLPPRSDDPVLRHMAQIDQNLGRPARPRENRSGPGDQPAAASDDGRVRRASFKAENGDPHLIDTGRVKARGPYTVMAGSVIPGALITPINSELPGLITGQVTQTVYDTVRGIHVLIPQGARLIGTYNHQTDNAQHRVQIRWDRIIFPNGQSFTLGEGMAGTDGQGRSGLRDKVNSHWGRIIGTAILSSVFNVGARVAGNQGDDLTQDIGNEFGQGINQGAQQILQRELQVKPTLTIRQGFRFNILVSRDLQFKTPYGG